jgi:hypothetical protein
MQVLQEHSSAVQSRRKRPSPCSGICMGVQRSEVNFAAIAASPMEAVCVRYIGFPNSDTESFLDPPVEPLIVFL